MNNIGVYKTYSSRLKDKYGVKVYKLPIKLPLTCPNRDGNLSVGGCIYCGEEGGSFENLSKELNIKDQLLKNKEYIGKRYSAEKFIAYFQNYTNTYMGIDEFKNMIRECFLEDIVGISISTRPDCIAEEHLKFLAAVQEEKNLEITIELGLQTVNYRSLKKLNRGHSLAEYIDSSIAINKYNLRNCTHLILNLPWDKMEDTIESAKILSALKVDEVKLHSLYIVKDTVLGDLYEKKQISIIDKDEYKKRVITFLRYLSPEVTIQRLIARAPKEKVLFANWGESWWKIRDEIVEEMKNKGYEQGDKYNYLHGKALKFD